jgi:hypothetical protein
MHHNFNILTFSSTSQLTTVGFCHRKTNRKTYYDNEK